MGPGQCAVLSTTIVLSVQYRTAINHPPRTFFLRFKSDDVQSVLQAEKWLCGLMKGTVTTPILPPKMLLVENDPATADEIRAALAGAGNGSFIVEWVRQLSEDLARLSKKGIAAILLELSLSDSHGIETYDKHFTAAPDVPILILGGNVNEAVGRCAQDYLLPGHRDYSLPRALRKAIEHKAVEDALYVEKARAVVTLNLIGDMVLYIDISGNITYSDSFVTLFLRGPKKRSRIMRCASRDAAWASPSRRGFCERSRRRHGNLDGSRFGAVRLSRAQSAANGVASLVNKYGSKLLRSVFRHVKRGIAPRRKAHGRKKKQ